MPCFSFDPARLVRLIFYVLALVWPAAPAAALDLDGTAVAWNRLVFRLADRPGDLQVEVTLSQVAPERLSELVGPGRDKPPPPADPPVWRMISTIDVRYTGQTYRTDVWFRPTNAAPLQRHRDKLGRGANRKTYRYLDDGVRRLRIEPDGRAEAERPPDRWSLVREDFFPYGPARAGCPVLSDPNLLLVIASSGAVTREAGAPMLCVFNKKTIYRVRLTAGPAQTLEAAYTEIKGETRTEVRRRAAVRTVRLEAFAPEADGVEPETFEFFEMSGKIEIDLDAESGLPLRISGEIAGFGRAAVVLGEADLRP